MIMKHQRVGRNDPCPCGSGLKYKKCCLGKEAARAVDLKQLYFKKYQIRLKAPEDIAAIKQAGRLALDSLRAARLGKLAAACRLLLAAIGRLG